MTIKNKKNGANSKKLSGKKMMLVTALLSGGVVIRVNNHINNSFGHAPKEVINFDLTLESTDVLIDDSGVFYVGQGTPIDNFNIYDFVTILDESGNIIADKDVTLEWDIKEYFEGTTFGTEGEYLITISATTSDGRTGELEYKLVVKEGHIFEEIKSIEDIEVDVDNKKEQLDFQEYFRVLNSTTGADTGAKIQSTLEDEDLRSIGTTQVIFYTELDGIKFTNSVHISVIDTVAPVINPAESFGDTNGYEWSKNEKSITINDLSKKIEDFNLDEFATAYDASGEYEMSWNFNEVMEGKLDEIATNIVTITATDTAGNASKVDIYVNISTVKIEFKTGISEVAFELFHTPDINDPKYKVTNFFDVFDAAGNPVADDRISWDLTEEMLSGIGEYRVTIEVLDANALEIEGSRGVSIIVEDTTAPVATLIPGAETTYDIEVDQFNSIDNLYMYLNGVANIEGLVSITDNSGVWGYRFEYNDQPLTDEILRTVGIKGLTLVVFDYDKEGNENNVSYLNDVNGQPLLITLNLIDTKEATVVITNEVIDLEVMQNATKEMIEISNYAEISDNSGSFVWDLRIKGSQNDVMDYKDILGKISSSQGIELELVVTDSSGNTKYSDMLLIVRDTQAPVLEVRKSEETININPSTSEINGYRDIYSYVSVNDNSGRYTLEWDFDTVVNLSVAGIYEVVVKAYDDAGNISEEIITFTVLDKEEPVIIVNTKTIEIEANEYINKDELEFDINLNDYITVTDNSNSTIETMFDYSNVDFSAVGIYNVIITATDLSGNSSQGTIEIKVIAGEPKVRVVNDQEIINSIRIENNVFVGIKIEVKNGKIIIERASQTNESEVLSHLTMDNLLEFLTIEGETIESQIWDLSTLDVSTVGTNNIDLTVTNNFGKTSVQTIEFVVIYEYDSLIKVSGNNYINLEIDTSKVMDETWFKGEYDVVDFVEYRASGGAGSIVWSANSFANIDFSKVGTYIISAAVTDGHNETENVSLNLNIIDTTGAVILAPDSTVIGVNENSTKDYDVNTFASATDNSDTSGASTVVLSWNLSTQVDFSKVGTYVVTIKAVDASGNETTKDITFEVEDTQAPVLVVNPGMDTQIIEINSRGASNFNVNSFVTATDNSGIAPELEWNIDDVDFSSINSYTVEISATDKEGNKSNVVTITFVIEDTIAPTIDINPAGLEELKVEIATKSESDYSDWLDDYVTVTDNSGESITPTWDITGVDFNTFGTYMVTIIAVDASNNTTTQVVSFGVSDTTAPVITIKDDKEITTLEVFDGKLADFTLSDFATCTDDSTCTIEWDIQNVDFSTVGTYVVTIKAFDIYGNESRAEITIEVQDTTKPEIVITRPEIVLSMEKFTSRDFDVNNFATVTDNYDKSVVLTWNIDSVDFDNIGTYPVTITAIDSNGNEAKEKTVEFKVEEINIILEEVSVFEIEVTQSPDVSVIDVGTYFTATQDNGTAVNSITWNLTNDMLKVYGTHSVILTITYDNIETIDIEVTLEVIDITPPVVIVDTQTSTVELGDSLVFDSLKPEDFVTASDNSGDFTYSWDFNSVVEQTVAGTYIVSITVTDVSGLETVVTTEIIVEDTTDPVLEFNDDFDRNNMIWSKSAAELSILAGDKAPGEIDLWELVTATDLSTNGLTISWSLTDVELNTVNHYTVDIEVSDGFNVSTETIVVNVLRPTPELNNYSVDRTYSDITVNVDITNIHRSLTGLTIRLEKEDGTLVEEFIHPLNDLDEYNISNVFSSGVLSNTEYKVILEYSYSTQLDKTTEIQTVTDTKDVKTLEYTQNDVLGKISNVYISHTQFTVNYELGNKFDLLTSARLVLIDSSNNETEHIMTLNSETGTHVFVNLSPNSDYRLEIRLSYDFNDGNNEQSKISDEQDISTLAYTEHDVITDITGITQTPSTINIDYNITDLYGLIITGGMKAKLYDARDMSLVAEKDLVTLSETVQFIGLDANTSYIVVIEAELDLRDGTNIIKETGTQTTTEAYKFEEITVNINNLVVDYNDITFDYQVFDPSGLLVGNTDADKLKISINGQKFDLGSLDGTVKLSDHLNEVDSDASYDVQIHFHYDLKDGVGSIEHDTDLYGFVESTRAYNLDQDLTLTSHNLASDMSRIYIDYSLRNLNLIGDMSTLAVTIDDLNGNSQKILFSALGATSLNGSIELDNINGAMLDPETVYQISITIDYDLLDGNGIQSNLLLLDSAQIHTKDVPLVGYNVVSTLTRGYTFINTDFNILDDGSHGVNLLDSFKIALLDENLNPVVGYDYIPLSVSAGDNTFKFENLLSDATYTIVYRIDNPYYTAAAGEDEFVEITRRVSTRTYDTNLINVNYTLTQGLTYLHLQDIEVLNTNEVFENIDYSSVILVITYTTRDGQLVTIERDLGSLTEGQTIDAIFTGIQSNRDVNIEFKLDYDLKDGEGIQSGTEEIVRTSDTKTLEYDFTFVIENDEVIVTGLTPGFNGTELIIFEEVEGYIVRNIKDDAFYGENIAFSELVIPRSLESVGQNAFRSVTLTSVDLKSVFEIIPTQTPRVNNNTNEGVLIIEANAFRDNQIDGFDFTTTETIGVSAFRNNDLTEVVLGNTVNYVGQEAFVNAGVIKLTTGELLNDGKFGNNTFYGNSINDLTVGSTDFKHNSLGYSKDVFNNTGFKFTLADSAVGKIEPQAWRYDISSPLYSDVPITDLTIGDGIEEIGLSAFYGNRLNEVVIGNGVHTIKGHVFNSTGINSVTLGDSLVTVGHNAFENNNITKLVFPETLEKIEVEAFSGNDIDELIIPDSVTTIESGAFENNGMTKLVIGELLSDENFGTDTFVGNVISDLTVGNIGFKHNSLGYSRNVFNNSGFKFTLADSAVGKIEPQAWRYDRSDSSYSDVPITDLTIGNGIEQIGLSAFYGNVLNEVKIGDGVHTIDGHVFNSTGIQKVTLGKSLVSVGFNAFQNNNLTELVFPETLEKIGVEAFSGNNIRDLVLPDSVSSIETRAFENNGMTKLKIGELLSDGNFGTDTFIGNSINDLTVGHIGFKHNSLGYSKNVFNNSGFKFTLADSATGTIASQAWRYDTSDASYSDVPIIDLTIGNGIEEIGLSAFYGNRLNEVVIGNSVHTVGAHSFNSTGITSLTLGDAVEEIGYNAFTDNNITGPLYLPDTLEDIGYQAFRNNNITEISLPKNIDDVGQEAFYNNNINKLTVPSGVTNSNFGTESFVGNSINEIVLGTTNITYNAFGNASMVFSGSGVKVVYTDEASGAIPNNAWRNTSGYSGITVDELTIGSAVTTIGQYAFEGNNISNLVMGDSVETIDYRAFYDSEINTVTFNDTIETIGSNSFGYNNLQTVVIPDDVETIGTYAFRGNSITSFNFVDGMTTISDGMLDNNNLTSLVIPDHITSIGQYAFRSNNISNITFNSNMTEINTGAFQNNSLTAIDIPSNITRILANAFAGNSIKTFEIPEHITYIGDTAFSTNGMTKLVTGDNITNSNLGSNVFTGNTINDLTIGDISLTHASFGPSSQVFSSSGFKITFADTVIGKIPDQAWRYDTSSSSYSDRYITQVNIGDGITSIGTSSFYGNRIANVALGANVTSIGNHAFDGNSISVLSMNDALKTIGSSAFISNSLTNVTIPVGVTSVGTYAFKNNNISTLTVLSKSSDSIFGTDTFTGNYITTLTISNVGYDHSSFGSSSSVFRTSGFKLIFADSASGKIADQAWRYGSGYSLARVSAVEFGSGITEIGMSSFMGGSLTSLTIPNTLTKIGNHTFDSNSISSLNLGSGLRSIGYYSFLNNNIGSLTIPSSLTYLGYQTFYGNSNLRSVVFKSGRVIYSHAFVSTTLFYNEYGGRIYP